MITFFNGLVYPTYLFLQSPRAFSEVKFMNYSMNKGKYRPADVVVTDIVIGAEGLKS